MPVHAPKTEKPTSRQPGARPAYRSIAESIRDKVTDGRLARGEQLPSHRQIAAEHGVAIGTVQQAVSVLVADGVLVTEANRGLFVAGGKRIGAGSASHAPGQQFDDDVRRIAAHVGVIAPMAAAWDATGARRIDDGQSGADVRRHVVASLERSIGDAGGSTCCRDAGGHKNDIPESIQSAVIQMVREGIDALVLVYVDDSVIISSVLPHIDIARTPLVVVSSDDSALPIPRLCLDQRTAGYVAAEHLIRQGCQHLAFVAPYQARWSAQRRLGAADAVRLMLPGSGELKAITRDVDVIDFDTIDAQYRGSVEMATEYFAGGPRHCDGFVCHNDWTAKGLVEVAATKGLVAGRDYLVVGFDDLPESRELDLTTLHPPATGFGREAAKIVFEQLSTGDRSAKRVSLHSQLIVRGSTRLGINEKRRDDKNGE